MDNVYGLISKPKLASAHIDKQEDMTGSDKFTKITLPKHRILPHGLQIYPLEY